MQETAIRDDRHAADALVILPGLLCDSRMFAHQLAAFEHSMVIGGFYGGASRLADMAGYVLDRMPERSAILGHSMGARVALEIVRRAPQRVSRLILASTGVHPVRPGERDGRHALRDVGRRSGIAALVDRWLPPMLSEAARHDATLVTVLRDMCIEAGLPTYEAQIEALLARPDVDQVLSRIQCPTLVIVGSEDQWASPAQHAEIADAIPGARLHVVEGAGHMLPAERPDEFNRVLAEWLALDPVKP
jgi:pimeloyl-ACP methyl ester carboxylesterase